MLIGLLAGAVAAVIAALLSLPLHSPDDILFNTATVTAGALVAGLAAALLRRALPARRFAVAWGLVCVAVLVALAAGESQFARMLQFGAPIAAVVFTTTGLMVGALAGHRLPMQRQAVAAAVGLAVALGIGLAGQGDTESGHLALPSAPTAAATRITTAATSVTAVAGAGATSTPVGTSSGAPTGPFAVPADVKGVTFTVGDGSQATFTVNEQLANLPLPSDAVVKSTALAGQLRLDGRPSTITLDLQQLASDQSRRNGVIRRMFARNPTATLTVTTLPALPERYGPGQVVRATVSGTLAINGVQRPITFEVEARLDGNTLHAVGRTAFVWRDFDIPSPSIAGIAQVQDKVAVEVLIAAHAQAG